MNLKDLPAGSSVFIDANIFLYPALNDPRFKDSCSAFLRRVSNGEVLGFTSVFVLNEVQHKLMVSELAQRRNVSGAKATQHLRDHSEEAKQLTQAWQDIEYIKAIPNLIVYEVTPDLFWKGVEQSKSVGLLAMDGAHVAVMEAHGLTNLASSDTHFSRVTWIQLCQP